jgi:hypothetical protein
VRALARAFIKIPGLSVAHWARRRQTGGGLGPPFGTGKLAKALPTGAHDACASGVRMKRE